MQAKSTESHRGAFASCCLLVVLLGGTSACSKHKAASPDPSSAPVAHAFDASGVSGFDQAPTKVVTGSADSSDSVIQTAAEDQNINLILPQCGITDLSNLNLQTISSIVNYDWTRIINAGVAVATVDITSTLNLQGTLAQTTLDVGVVVDGVAGTVGSGTVADLTPIKNQAETLSSGFRGAATAYSAPFNSNYSGDWSGVVCTILAANRMTNKRAGHTTESTYSPDFPPNVSPLADAVRYDTELGDFHYFGNIAATVTSTDNPLLNKGDVIQGSVLVEKIPPSRDTPAGKIQGDTAYRVTNFFGTPEKTLALGFHLWTEYYIDHSQRAFSGFVANVGDEQLMYFVGTYKGSGAPAASPPPAASAQPAGATYTKDIQPLLAANCTSCHNAAGAPRVDLSTYAGAQQNGAALTAKVDAGSMPPSGALTAAQQALFDSWSKSGFPQN